MYFFPNLEPVCCSMSSSNCCFLTCIQVSQEADQVVWYSHLFQNFPHSIVICIVKGFGIVNKDLPNPGIEPRSPTSQVASLPVEPQWKSKITGVGSLSLHQGIFLTQESNQGLRHCRWILHRLSCMWKISWYHLISFIIKFSKLKWYMKSSNYKLVILQNL